jgi:hypothetical protein
MRVKLLRVHKTPVNGKTSVNVFFLSNIDTRNQRKLKVKPSCQPLVVSNDHPLTKICFIRLGDMARWIPRQTSSEKRDFLRVKSAHFN